MSYLNINGTVFDIQSFALHDGPGIRTLIFLKGCPLKCLWCANPEGQNSFPEIRYNSTKCLGCFECIKSCTNNAITISEKAEKNKIIIDRQKCRQCTDIACVEACPNDALQTSGKSMSVKEVINKIKRDFPYYRGNGGVTLSGGDPTYQPEFAIELLKACKEEYIHTAIESAMFSNTEIINKFLPFTDLFLIDIKHMDSNKHKKLTGVENTLILKNIENLSKTKPVLIRIPIIPNFNDDDKNIYATAKFCFENEISRINILPYHRLGESKYSQLGLDYPMPSIDSPDTKKMEHIKAIIESCKVKCIIG